MPDFFESPISSLLTIAEGTVKICPLKFTGRNPTPNTMVKNLWLKFFPNRRHTNINERARSITNGDRLRAVQ